MRKIIDYLMELIHTRFTGTVHLHFHNGTIKDVRRLVSDKEQVGL